MCVRETERKYKHKPYAEVEFSAQDYHTMGRLAFSSLAVLVWTC